MRIFLFLFLFENVVILARGEITGNVTNVPFPVTGLSCLCSTI